MRRDVLAVDQCQRRETTERVVDIGDLLGNQFELIGRQVFGDHATLAIENQAANRGNRLDTHPVTLRFLGEQFVIDDLQENKAHDNHAEQQRRDDRRNNDPTDKQPPLGVMVLDRRQQLHVSPPREIGSARRRGTGRQTAR